MSCMMIFFCITHVSNFIEFFPQPLNPAGLCVQGSVSRALWPGRTELRSEQFTWRDFPRRAGTNDLVAMVAKTPSGLNPILGCCQPLDLDCPWVTGRKRGWCLQLISTILRWHSGFYKPSSTMSGLWTPSPHRLLDASLNQGDSRREHFLSEAGECHCRSLGTSPEAAAGIPREPARKCWRSMQGPAQPRVPWMSPPGVWWLDKNTNI